MGFAVELYFDAKTESKLLDLRQELVEEGVPKLLHALGERPHVSLAVFSEIQLDSLVEITKKFVDQLTQFEIQFSSVGAFTSPSNVLFCSPVPTKKLLDYHARFHQILNEQGLICSDYYLPSQWVPHSSVELEIPNDLFAKAFEIVRQNFKPISGQFQEIGIVEFRPIKSLALWELKRI